MCAASANLIDDRQQVGWRIMGERSPPDAADATEHLAREVARLRRIAHQLWPQEGVEDLRVLAATHGRARGIDEAVADLALARLDEGDAALSVDVLDDTDVVRALRSRVRAARVEEQDVAGSRFRRRDDFVGG